jgi:hypothetical protein
VLEFLLESLGVTDSLHHNIIVEADSIPECLVYLRSVEINHQTAEIVLLGVAYSLNPHVG